MNIRFLLSQSTGISLNPPAEKFAIAAFNDFLMDCGLEPLSRKKWESVFSIIKLTEDEIKVLEKKNFVPPFHFQNLCWAAHFGRELCLFEITKDQLNSNEPVNKKTAFRTFFYLTQGIPPQLISTSEFRKEEFLRCWAAAFGLDIEGESPQDSHKKLYRLNYLATLIAASEAEEDLQSQIRERELALAELQKKIKNERPSYE